MFHKILKNIILFIILLLCLNYIISVFYAEFVSFLCRSITSKQRKRLSTNAFERKRRLNDVLKYFLKIEKFCSGKNQKDSSEELPKELIFGKYSKYFFLLQNKSCSGKNRKTDFFINSG